MRAFSTHRECINVFNINVHAEISNEDRDLNSKALHLYACFLFASSDFVESHDLKSVAR